MPAVSAQLNGRLPEGLVCRVEGRAELTAGGGDGRHFVPDGGVVRRPAPDRRGGGGATAVLDGPEIVTITRPHDRLSRAVIYELDGEEVITIIEVLSPRNKAAGRREFRQKQASFLAAGVAVVEIDLLRRGGWAMACPREDVPETHREPYRLISVDPGADDLTTRIPRVRLREPLPPLPVPLRYGEEPVALELQPLIDDLWRGGAYWSTNYGAENVPPFPPEDAAWIAGRVREWAARGGPAGGGAGGNPEAAGGEGAGPTAPADAG